MSHHEHHHTTKISNVKKIKLNVRTDFKHNTLAAIARTIHKHNIYQKISESEREGYEIRTKLRARIGQEPLQVYGPDVEWYGNVSFGNPGQTFSIDFDTGSADLWIHGYNPSHSSTYVSDGRAWHITYADGSSASGKLVQDTVSIGSIVIAKQTFANVTRETGSFATSGLCGLAFDTIVTIPGVKTVVDNMINQKLIPNPEFSFALVKSSQGGGGEITFGGTDTNYYTGTILYLPVQSNGFWTVQLDNVYVGNTALGLSGPVIMDTGTTLILMSHNDTAAIYNQIPGSQFSNQYGAWLVPTNVDESLQVSFQFQNKNFAVPVSDLLFESVDATHAYGGIQELPGNYPTILGDVFIKNVYCVFNQGAKTVGLATRK